MTEKYILEQSNLFENHFFIGSKLKMFTDKETAELVCKLLNENDSRLRIKPLMRAYLTTNLKSLLSTLKNKSQGLSKEYFTSKKLEIETAIEIISNLPTEE